MYIDTWFRLPLAATWVGCAPASNRERATAAYSRSAWPARPVASTARGLYCYCSPLVALVQSARAVTVADAAQNVKKAGPGCAGNGS